MQEINEDQFYEIATKIVSESEVGRFATSSPALILPQERGTKFRNRYFETLISRISNGMEVKYLFNLDKTKELISNCNDRIDILNKWTELLVYNNLDLRFTNEEFESCIIGEKEAVFKRDKKRFLVSSGSEEYVNLLEAFDNIFERASGDNKEVIEELSFK